MILPALNNFEKKSANNNTNNNYFAALLAFRDAPSATMFAKNFDGQPFSNVNDEEICRCLFVKSISFGKDEDEEDEDDDDDDSDDEETNYTELPANCPVCLDRLDGEVSGVVPRRVADTTSTFGNACLASPEAYVRCVDSRWTTRRRKEKRNVKDASARTGRCGRV